MNSEEFLDALLAMPNLGAALVSPDGKWVAWSWFGIGPAADVFVVPTDGSVAPLRLTDTPDNTLLVSWTHDSKAVLVQQDHNGNERAQLFRLDISQPGQMQPLTEESPNFFLRGGQMHPNNRWLIYGANYDAATGEEVQTTWLYRHDLETGERKVLARPKGSRGYIPKLNRQGSHILYNRNDLHPAGGQVWLVDIEGQDDREILNFGASSKVSASWFPDGERALVLAEAGNYRRLGVWHMGSNSLNWLIDDPARNLEGAFVPHGSKLVVVVEVKGARNRASLLNPETGEETPLPDLSGNLAPLAPVENGEWVGRYYSARQPADLVRFSLDKFQQENFVSLTRLWERTPLRPEDLTGAEDWHWQAQDGLPIQGWLFRTRQPAKGTILHIHGGPTAHSEDRFMSQVQFFAAQGFNVLLPNYRGSTGFSLAFQEAIKADGWGGREQQDIIDGAQSLITAGIAEAGKVGITGTSYGGYSSWHAITHYSPELIAASAPVCGMTDLVIDYETTRPDLRPYSEEMMGGRPDQVPERYYERSPINFVQNIKGALLIVQGLQDPNVTPENVRVVREVLEQNSIQYEFLGFEDEGHGIIRPKTRRF
jgi:dipeptidyl aminopeptidase/acylaminoacyl peptidase